MEARFRLGKILALAAPQSAIPAVAELLLRLLLRLLDLCCCQVGKSAGHKTVVETVVETVAKTVVTVLLSGGQVCRPVLKLDCRSCVMLCIILDHSHNCFLMVCCHGLCLFIYVLG